MIDRLQRVRDTDGLPKSVPVPSHFSVFSSSDQSRHCVEEMHPLPKKEKTKKRWVMSFYIGVMGFWAVTISGVADVELTLTSQQDVTAICWCQWGCLTSVRRSGHSPADVSGRVLLTAFGFLQGPAVQPGRVFLAALGWLSSALHVGGRAFPGAAQRHLHDAGTGKVEQSEHDALQRWENVGRRALEITNFEGRKWSINSFIDS